jgi:hypothetical protein
MIHLNNKYGLDGRDPNSYSGVFWVLAGYVGAGTAGVWHNPLHELGKYCAKVFCEELHQEVRW